MLPTELLSGRYNGEEFAPTRLPLDKKTLLLAADTIDIFTLYIGKKRLELDQELAVLEGAETDYRVKRGLAHLLLAFCTFETVSPLEPPALRERVFALSAERVPSPGNAAAVIEEVAAALTRELEREVKELRRANAILRSASAFFAAELDRPSR